MIPNQRNRCSGGHWDLQSITRSVLVGNNYMSESRLNHIGFRCFRPAQLPVPQVPP